MGGLNPQAVVWLEARPGEVDFRGQYHLRTLKLERVWTCDQDAKELRSLPLEVYQPPVALVCKIRAYHLTKNGREIAYFEPEPIHPSPKRSRQAKKGPKK